MMKKEPFAAFLVGTFSVCAVASVVLATNFWFSARALRRLQPQAMAYQARLSLAQSLLNETLEYSKRNPAINPLLQSLNLKTNAVPLAPAAGPGPGSK